MTEREIEIKFGTVYKPQDRINGRTGEPYPEYQKYVITDLMSGDVIGSNWLDETGEKPRLAIGGTHAVDDIVEHLGTMGLEEVIDLVKSSGWYSTDVEKYFRAEARKEPRRIRLK